MQFANGQVKEGNFENNVFIGEKNPEPLDGLYRAPSNGYMKKRNRRNEMMNEKLRKTGEI